MSESGGTFQSNAICVDFDGVIAAFAQDIESFGSPIPGAGEALRELKSLGYKIIIHTARPSRAEHVENLRGYLRRERIPFDEINSNGDCPWPSIKPLADVYIDDRALRFEGDWRKTMTQLKNILSIRKIAPAPRAYEDLLKKVVVRSREVQRFDEFLRNETSWLTAPASSRFHLAREGGLVEHSINVAHTLLTLRETLAPDISEESCVIVALYHDVGKAGMPGAPLYLPNPNRWMAENRGVQYVINPDLVHMDIATRSLYLVGQSVAITDEEAQAIRYHDGQYVDENRTVAHRETRLTRLLQYADNWSGCVLEEKERVNGHERQD
jgi:hypothetical protein